MTGSGIEEKSNGLGLVAIPNGGMHIHVLAADDIKEQTFSPIFTYTINPPACSFSTPFFRNPESETPASLSSPLVGIVDLSRSVKTTELSPITHGGFSDIYKAEWERTIHEDDGSVQVVVIPVAVKLLRVLSAKDNEGVKARKRLNREVYVWHRLDNRNIATFFGTSYHMAGRPAMVMQWYANGSATEYLKEKAPGTNRLMLILDVARGLKYLHTLKIVHGDLKGNNVLIADDGHAVLSDFGLSQVIDDLVGPTGWTLSNPDMGPLRWQAPELLIDEHCRPSLQTDVWSFGCTAYELLTGNYPYQHRSRDSVILQDIHAGVKPANPTDLLHLQNWSSVWAIIDACWAFDPTDRLSMVDVVAKLEAICEPY